MFKNLLKVTIRSLMRQKGYSLINILGLTTGIVCSFLLALYIMDEISFDRQYEKADRIYRVNSRISEPDDSFVWPSTQFPLGPAVQAEFPEVKSYTRLMGSGRLLIKSGESVYFEEGFRYADSSFFDLFEMEFIEGNPTVALKKARSVVITESVKEKYFGSARALGEVLDVEDEDDLEVTGVIRNLPDNTSLNFDALISTSGLPQDYNGWGSFFLNTFLLLDEGANSAEVEKKLESIVETHVATIFDQFNITVVYALQPLTKLHLYNREWGMDMGGDISYVYIFAAVALFVLLIASINYMNMATVRSARRAREVGIRKTVGSTKIALRLQFTLESVAVTLISAILSLGILLLLIYPFNALSGKEFAPADLLQPEFVLLMLGIVIFVGLVAGSYPAFYLSRFSPVEVLKGRISSRGGSPLLRKSLVVVQFTISIVMIISTWIVYNQLQYLKEKDLGFNQDKVLVVPISNREVKQQANVLADKVRQLSMITQVATTNTIPGGGLSKNLMMVETGTGFEDKGIDQIFSDENYLEAMQFELVAGRNFSSSQADSGRVVLVNEAALPRMGWTKETALGKRVKPAGDSESEFYEVVGVVKNFHQLGLYDPIETLFIFHSKYYFNNYLVARFSQTEPGEVIEQVKSSWKEIFPSEPFEYSFLDQDFEEQFEEDNKRGTIFSVFSGITILLSCIGLIGLASFSAAQRTKEIGIRKVVGASVGQLVTLLSRDFIILVLIATVLASGLAWYFMSSWLESFVYQAPIPVYIFLAVAFFAVLITLLAVSYHSLRAARANPVNSLKSD